MIDSRPGFRRASSYNYRLNTGGGGGPGLGILGDQIFNTRTADLKGLWLFYDLRDDVLANGFLVDSSGNGNHMELLSGTPNLIFYDYQAAGEANILFSVTNVGTPIAGHSWNKVITGTSMLSPFTYNVFVAIPAGTNAGLGGLNNPVSNSGRGFVGFLASTIISELRPRYGTDTGGFGNIQRNTGITYGTDFNMFTLTSNGTNTAAGYKSYFNGVLQTPVSPVAVPLNTTPIGIAVGNQGGPNNPNSGSSRFSIGPVSYWQAELNATQIADIFTASGL